VCASRSGDVGHILRASRAAFDAILLDVDNGPDAFTATGNAWLYNDEGLAAARGALRPGGMLAVWSAWEDRRFEQRLRYAGFTVKRGGTARRWSRETTSSEPGARRPCRARRLRRHSRSFDVRIDQTEPIGRMKAVFVDRSPSCDADLPWNGGVHQHGADDRAASPRPRGGTDDHSDQRPRASPRRSRSG
jgi:hypothetical protein